MQEKPPPLIHLLPLFVFCCLLLYLFLSNSIQGVRIFYSIKHHHQVSIYMNQVMIQYIIILFYNQNQILNNNNNHYKCICKKKIFVIKKVFFFVYEGMYLIFHVHNYLML
jgi:hypothetical protein